MLRLKSRPWSRYEYSETVVGPPSEFTLHNCVRARRSCEAWAPAGNFATLTVKSRLLVTLCPVRFLLGAFRSIACTAFYKFNLPNSHSFGVGQRHAINKPGVLPSLPFLRFPPFTQWDCPPKIFGTLIKHNREMTSIKVKIRVLKKLIPPKPRFPPFLLKSPC